MDLTTQKRKPQKKGIALMLACSFLVSVGQLIWKFYDTYGIWSILAGFSVYGCGALLMIIAYRYGELSVLQPLNSVSYIFSLVFGTLVLHETITGMKYLGVGFLLAGVIFISRGDKK